ncbi:MAG: ribonuclease T2-like [Claussenomyces sp. TS43310]|nr:MAG: ribonuclease T2-like [Claussenomyces sp. TS43310]
MAYVGAGSLLSQLPVLSGVHGGSQDMASEAALPFSQAPSCPADGPTSCHNSTTSDDTCCFIYPGGQLLQTQFWDTSPAIGPSDSWTLHGLWPDLCDGTYDQFCNEAPKYNNITQILQAADQIDLLNYMKSYWLPNSGTSEHFWEHEWNKHGTCINTLSPGCYGNAYTAGMEVVDFFTRTVELFKTLDSYTALANAGITPSTSVTYTQAQIQQALTAVTGSSVVLGCSRGQLNQAWYSYNVKGSLQTGTFVPTDPAGSGKGTCPTTGIKYLPKS